MVLEFEKLKILTTAQLQHYRIDEIVESVIISFFMYTKIIFLLKRVVHRQKIII